MRKYLTYKILLVSSLLFFLSSQLYCLQLEWIENKGQWDKQVLYASKTNTGYAFITINGIKIVQYDSTSLKQFHVRHQNVSPKQKRHHSFHNVTPLKGKVVSMRYVHPSKKITVQPQQQILTYNNYLIGDDTTKWARHCNLYTSILVKDVYENVDFKYYSKNGNLKYDILLHPNASLSKVMLRYGGADNVNIYQRKIAINDKDIITIKQDIPKSYHLEENSRYVEEDVFFRKVSSNTFGFDVSNYDNTKEYIIDPTYYFSSFSGSKSDNWGFTATYGSDGSLYSGGIIMSSGFPVSDGSFQQDYGGTSNSEYFSMYSGAAPDIVIFKFSFDGRKRLFATYLGGKKDDLPFSLIEDNNGNLVILGVTNSTDYPSQNLHRYGPNGGEDIVITKLSADGSNVIGSARIGGSAGDAYNSTFKYSTTGSSAIRLARYYSDNNRSEVIVDNNNFIHVISNSQSSNFPTTANAFQKRIGGLQDAVYIKMSSDLSQMLFSSYLGGSKSEAGFTMDIDESAENIYIAGTTLSKDLPFMNATSMSTKNSGGVDGFVYHISNSTFNILHGTYIGTSTDDYIFGLKLDQDGSPHIVGNTYGTWPIINAKYFANRGKHFVGKLNKGLSSWIFTTSIGSPNATLPNLSIVAFSVDQCGNMYYSGFSDKDLFSTSNPNTQGTNGLPITNDAIQSTTDGDDFYFGVIENDAKSLLYGTFFGQRGGQNPDHVDGGTSRFDKKGIIYQTICANCNGGARYPVTSGAWSTTNQALGPLGIGGCNMASVKIGFNLAGVFAKLKTSINGVSGATKGCAPLYVTFIDEARLARKYIYSFGDGTEISTTNTSVIHQYEKPGMYKATLYAYDSLSCNKVDSSSVIITISENKAILSYSYRKIGDCQSNTYSFTNTSTAQIGDITQSTYKWYIDGKMISELAYHEKFVYTFPSDGSYKIGIAITNPDFCNAKTIKEATLFVSDNIEIGSLPNIACLGRKMHFTHISSAGQSYFWDFGDGNTSTLREPVHTYAQNGTYTIKFVMSDPTACNLIDSTTYQLTVFTPPQSLFSNQDIKDGIANFTNESKSYDSQKWKVTYQGTISSFDTKDLSLSFERNGIYNVCLYTSNQNSCYDTLCQDILIDPKTIFAIPNAFSPNGDGINDKLDLFVSGIRDFNIKIYDRRGTIVFQTTSTKAKWDGFLNGKVLPMDDYYYKADIILPDNTTVKTYKGRITLIR